MPHFFSEPPSSSRTMKTLIFFYLLALSACTQGEEVEEHSIRSKRDFARPETGNDNEGIGEFERETGILDHIQRAIIGFGRGFASGLEGAETEDNSRNYHPQEFSRESRTLQSFRNPQGYPSAAGVESFQSSRAVIDNLQANSNRQEARGSVRQFGAADESPAARQAPYQGFVGQQSGVQDRGFMPDEKPFSGFKSFQQEYKAAGFGNFPSLSNVDRSYSLPSGSVEEDLANSPSNVEVVADLSPRDGVAELSASQTTISSPKVSQPEKTSSHKPILTPNNGGNRGFRHNPDTIRYNVHVSGKSQQSQVVNPQYVSYNEKKKSPSNVLHLISYHPVPAPTQPVDVKQNAPLPIRIPQPLKEEVRNPYFPHSSLPVHKNQDYHASSTHHSESIGGDDGGDGFFKEGFHKHFGDHFPVFHIGFGEESGSYGDYDGDIGNGGGVS